MIFNNKSPACRQAGFTLIELLVSIAIIATLTAILLPNFMGARERANDAKKKQDLTAIKNALRLYYNDNQEYPATDADGLKTVLPSYMPGISGIGYTFTYSQTNAGDGFTLNVKTDATNNDENYESQSRCGIGGSISGYYYVCAN